MPDAAIAPSMALRISTHWLPVTMIHSRAQGSFSLALKRIMNNTKRNPGGATSPALQVTKMYAGRNDLGGKIIGYVLEEDWACARSGDWGSICAQKGGFGGRRAFILDERFKGEDLCSK